jgi:hypothetical protein
MSFGKELGAIVGIFLTVGSIVFILSVLSGSMRMMQGDVSAAGDVAGAIADEAVSGVQWSVGVAVLIALASALGLGSVVAWLRRYC